jgi:NPCBM/NEW2 domain
VARILEQTMAIRLQCPQCTSTLGLPDGAEQRSIRCPHCNHVFKVQPAAEPADVPIAEPVFSLDDRESDTRRDARIESDRRTDSEVPRPRRRYRGEDDEARDRPSRRSRDDDDRDDRRRGRYGDRDYADRPRRYGGRSRKTVSEKLIIGLAIFIGIGAVVGIILLVVNLSSNSIADDKWKPFEAPGRCKALMPGTPRQVNQVEGGIHITQHLVEPNRNCAFIVGYNDAKLTPQRLAQGAELILNDASDGALQGMADEGPAELRRESIDYRGYPGKQIVVDLKKRNVTMVCRTFLIEGRLYFLLAGGKGYSENHKDVKKFYDSFEVIEASTAPAGKKPFDTPAGKKQIEVPKETYRPEYEQPDPTVLGRTDPDIRLWEGPKKIYLNDMAEFGWKTKQAYTSFGKNGHLGYQSAPNNRSIVSGKPTTKTLSMHASSPEYTRICYSLGRRAKQLHGAAAFSEDTPGQPSPCRWVVMGDGKVLWRSNAINKFGVQEGFVVDVSNVNVLELRIYVESGSSHLCHSVWIDPYVVRDVTKMEISNPEGFALMAEIPMPILAFPRVRSPWQFGNFDRFGRQMPMEYRASKPTFAEIESDPSAHRGKFPLRVAVVEAISDLRTFHPDLLVVDEIGAPDTKTIGSEMRTKTNQLQGLRSRLVQLKTRLEEAEKHRNSETSKRWLAHYDYLVALVEQQRFVEAQYSATLADMQRDIDLGRVERRPKLAPNENGWRLVQFAFGTAPAIEQLKARLDKLSQDYPETPWSTLAKMFDEMGVALKVIPAQLDKK